MYCTMRASVITSVPIWGQCGKRILIVLFIQRFIQYLASRNTLFNLSNFLDKSGLQGKVSFLLNSSSVIVCWQIQLSNFDGTWHWRSNYCVFQLRVLFFLNLECCYIEVVCWRSLLWKSSLRKTSLVTQIQVGIPVISENSSLFEGIYFDD